MSTGGAKLNTKTTPLMSAMDNDITIDMEKTNDWYGSELKEDPNDNVGFVKSNMINPTDDPPPPTFTRRMSSQLSIQLDRQTSGVAGYIPEGISSYIPGLAKPKTQQLKATYFCNICFTKYPIDEGFTLRQCQHEFCIECIKGFCTNKINNGIVYMNCFHPVDDNNGKPCGQNIEQQDIHQLVDQETWHKYEKFKSNLENNLSRQCPYCDNTQIGDKLTNIIECNKCNKQYCLIHSNAHPMTETCESYDLRTAKENKMNEMALQEMGDGVKPCPKCQFRIIKNGGCNHMKCVRCGCSFCWLCMEVIEDVELPFHYKDPNSKCKGQQFAGMEGENPPLAIMIILVICMLIFCIPGTIMGIVFGCLCHPIYALCCGESGDGHTIFHTIGFCSTIWMMIPAVIIMIILVICWTGLKATYDLIQGVCTCLPSCPPSWIDQVQEAQRQQALGQI